MHAMIDHYNGADNPTLGTGGGGNSRLCNGDEMVQNSGGALIAGRMET